jgi:hypothetical protein
MSVNEVKMVEHSGINVAFTNITKLQKEPGCDSLNATPKSPQRRQSPYNAQRAEPKPHEQPFYDDPHYAHCQETCHRICDARIAETESHAQGGWHETYRIQSFKVRNFILPHHTELNASPHCTYSGNIADQLTFSHFPIRLAS